MDFNQYKEKEQKRLEIAIKHLENGVDFCGYQYRLYR